MKKLAVAALCVPAVIYLGAQSRSPVGEWASYGGSNWSQKYSPLSQINRANFASLKVVWTWRTLLRGGQMISLALP